MLKKLLVGIVTSGIVASSLSAMDPSGFYVGISGTSQFMDSYTQYGAKAIGGWHACDYADLEMRIGGISEDEPVKSAFLSEFFVKPKLELTDEWEDTTLYAIGGITYFDYKRGQRHGHSYEDHGWAGTVGLGAAYTFGNTFEHQVFVDWTTMFANDPFGEDPNTVNIGYIYNF